MTPDPEVGRARKPKRILVVEDDTVLHEIIAGYITQLDPSLRVEFVVTADEAADMIVRRHLRFDAVIADILVPGKLNGLALREICAEHLPRAAFLVISGMGYDRFRGLSELDPPPFLAKPFDSKKFGTFLGTAMKKPEPVKKTPKILIVAEDLALRELVAEICLEVNPKARVERTPSGDEAMSRLHNSHKFYDLVITDVRLPGAVSGIDILNFARTMTTPPQLLLMSSYSRTELEKILGGTPAPECLWKPFGLEEATRTFQKMLTKKFGSDKGD
jgi:CheY-like chemotaxis protein